MAERLHAYLASSACCLRRGGGAAERLAACGARLPRAGGLRRVFLGTILEDMTERETAFTSGAAPREQGLDPVLHARFGADIAITRVHAACASGAVAIGLARQALRDDEEAAAAIGYEEDSRFIRAGFAALRTLAAGRPAPFTAGRDGFALAPGAGAVLLSTRGPAPVSVAGFAATNDAHHPTGPHREGDGLRRAIAGCLRDARREPADVELLKLSASGTRYSDEAEYRALSAVFGARLPSIPCFAPRARCGHLQGAAGVVETIAAAAVLRSGILPSVPALRDATIAFDLDLRAAPRRVAARNALLLFSGFGGQNACLFLERRTP